MGIVFVVRRLYTTRTTIMNPIGLLVSLAALGSASVIPLAVPASVAVRAPSHDSAIIQSHRLGGNFHYRFDEAHAYAVQTPVLGQRTVPIGVSYHQGTPIVRTSTDYVSHLVPQTGIATYQAPAQVIAQPIVQQQAIVSAPTYYNQGVVGGVYAGGFPHNFGHAFPSGVKKVAVVEPAAAEPAAETAAEPAAEAPAVTTA